MRATGGGEEEMYEGLGERCADQTNSCPSCRHLVACTLLALRLALLLCALVVFPQEEWLSRRGERKARAPVGLRLDSE
jgi:hypothetical protein